MKYKELKEIVDIIKMIPDEEKQEAAIKYMLPSAGMGEVVESNVPVNHQRESAEILQKQEEVGVILKFTKKEISGLPMRFKKELLINDKIVKCRKRKSGRNGVNYEIRYRRHGYNVCVSSNVFEEAREKFIAALNAVEHGVPKSKVPITFHEFAMYYFEKYRKRKVAEITYENDMYRYKKHIQPYFKSIRLIDITPMMCQDYLDELAKKSTKTSSEVHSILNIVLKNVIAHGIIVRNPLAVVLKTEHTSEHGVALSKEEEKKLLDAMKGTKYEVLFAVALYTGMRPNEYQTAVIEGDFIKAVNSKRKKKGKVEYKKIPITTMLRPYLNGVTKFEFPMVKYMRDKMNTILPDHILYDLRTTFYTRCEECGVAEPARDHFVGHSRGVLNKTYSDLSDEYLLQEGKKLVW